MTFAERNRIFLAKLQKLPENRKKVILWTIVVILVIVMGYFWIKETIDLIPKINEEFRKSNIPQFDTPEIPEIPSLDILQTTTPSDQTI